MRILAVNDLLRMEYATLWDSITGPVQFFQFVHDFILNLNIYGINK